MRFSAVLQILQSEGGVAGETAKPGGADYARAQDLDWRRCECSFRRAGQELDYDFIARTPRGAILYLGKNKAGLISCGRKGHHYLAKTKPCV